MKETGHWQPRCCLSYKRPLITILPSQSDSIGGFGSGSSSRAPLARVFRFAESNLRARLGFRRNESTSPHEARHTLLHHMPEPTSSPSAANPHRKLPYFGVLVAAEDGSGLTERSEKPGSDPIFGDGISPA